MCIPKHPNLLLLLLVLVSSFSVSLSQYVWAGSPGSGDYSSDYDYTTPPPPYHGIGDYPYQHPVFLCNADDSALLYKIKESLGSTYYFNSWVPDSDCCDDWDYIECDMATGRVVKFDFTNHFYRRLDSLSSLSPLPPRAPYVAFPPEIGGLTALKTLIFTNGVSGPIPCWLTNLKDLTKLDLSKNSFSGRIPQCLTELKSLTYLSLSDNQLSGRIPPYLSNFTRLETLSLSNNMLMGRIPLDFLGSYVGAGLSLSLGFNNLGGHLPATFAKVNFTAFSVPNNNLSGDASFLFGKDKLLSSIDISRNRFRFDISKLVMPSGCVSLLVNNNILFGKLPPSLVDLASLNALNVSNNKLSGKIPVGGKLQTFPVSSYANNTRLCGAPLPPCTRT